MFFPLTSFREDCEILVEQLTQLWMAKGFISAFANKKIEDVAYGCLIELECLCEGFMSKQKP